MFTLFFRKLSPAGKIALIAVFIALSIVANTVLDIDIPPKNKITVTYFIGFASAYLLGAVPAAAIAFVGDGLGWIIMPDGPYWLYGLTNAIFAFLTAVILHLLPLRRKRAIYIKAAIAFAACYLVCTVCINSCVDYTYALVYLWGGSAQKGLFAYLAGYFPPRIAIQSAVYAGNVALSFAALPFLERLARTRPHAKESET